MILGQREDLAVFTCVDRGDVRIINAHINAVFFDVVCQIQQDIIFHVDLCVIGMHPEYICEFSAGSARFKQCPVVIPVNNLDLNFGIAQSCPVITDFLDACLLVGVPDVDRQSAGRSRTGPRRTGISAGGRSRTAAAACGKSKCHNSCQCKCHYFFHVHTLPSF